MEVTRRQLLGGAAAAALTGSCGREETLIVSERRQEPPKRKPVLAGHVLGFGVSSSAIEARFSRSPTEGPFSVLTDVDLSTGEVRHTPYRVTEGHEPLLVRPDLMICVSDGGERILFIEPRTHELLETINADPGFEFSGHARVIDDAVFVTVRERGDGKMRGRLDVFDLASRKRVNSVATGGHVPHEVALLDDRDEIAISHYGHHGGHFEREPFYWDIKEPAVTFLDRATLKIKRRFVYDKPLALTHMRRAADGLLYIVAAQYVRNDAKGRAQLPDGFVPGPLETQAGRIGVPGPVVVVDPERGIIDEVIPEPAHHRKQQSVGVHSGTGFVFVTFTYSDQVLRIEPGSRDVRYFAAKDLGLIAPCGVADIPGTPHLAISGRDAGLTVVEAATGQPVKTYAADLFSNVHLGYMRA